MDDSTDLGEIKPYSIYLMEDEWSWYIGSAWNKSTPLKRYNAHYGGKGGARLLWDAIQGGRHFSQCILDSGQATLFTTHCLEEAWIASFLVDDQRECLNIDLFPSGLGVHCPGAPSEAMSVIAIERWNDPTTKAIMSAAIADGMARMSEEAKAACTAKRLDTLRNQYKPPTHCKYGHELTPENTWINGGYPACRECKRIKEQRGRSQPPKAKRPKRTETHCYRGHELTTDSVKIRADGYEECRECRKENDRAHRLREKQGKSTSMGKTV